MVKKKKLSARLIRLELEYNRWHFDTYRTFLIDRVQRHNTAMIGYGAIVLGLFLGMITAMNLEFELAWKVMTVLVVLMGIVGFLAYRFHVRQRAHIETIKKELHHTLEEITAGYKRLYKIEGLEFEESKPKQRKPK